jgi:hypothetical protein
MPPEIQALIDKPILLIAVLFVGAFAGMQVERFLSMQRRAAWRRRNAGKWEKRGRDGKLLPFQPKQDALPAKAPDAADQLRTVMKAEIKARPLLNKSEARVFSVLDKIVIEMRPGWQVMAQVSLGEVLKCEDREAYWCINAKRVDFLIVDSECRPVGAIEYQGGAHHQGTAAARDAVKKEALRRAGIGYEEILAGHHTPAELRRLIERLLKKPPG